MMTKYQEQKAREASFWELREKERLANLEKVQKEYKEEQDIIAKKRAAWEKGKRYSKTAEKKENRNRKNS